MSDPVAWGLAIAGILAAFSTAVVNIIVALANSKKLTEVATKQGDVVTKQAEVHDLVNSNHKELKGELAKSVAEVKELTAQLARAGQTPGSNGGPPA